jgi:riboflavin synthase
VTDVFSGIVERVGVVLRVEERATTRRLRVEAPELAPELAPGDSVAVDGACLTVTAVDATSFAVDVIGTTLQRTIAGTYRDGSRVNLERALLAGARLDGHLVQGHVDAVGYLEQFVKDGDFWLMDFRIPADVHAQTIEHGSITLNGVSLTVSELLPSDGVRIGVIPFTHEHTNLGTLRPGALVNVEGDLIGKYVARLLAQRGRP